jgi:hypothetical protein
LFGLATIHYLVHNGDYNNDEDDEEDTSEERQSVETSARLTHLRFGLIALTGGEHGRYVALRTDLSGWCLGWHRLIGYQRNIRHWWHLLEAFGEVAVVKPVEVISVEVILVGLVLFSGVTAVVLASGVVVASVVLALSVVVASVTLAVVVQLTDVLTMELLSGVEVIRDNEVMKSEVVVLDTVSFLPETGSAPEAVKQMRHTNNEIVISDFIVDQCQGTSYTI